MAADERRAEVRNAADPEQVYRAGRKDKRKESARRQLYAAILATVDGRAFCWALLEKAKVFESIWHPSALIHYNAGRQDFGHELMADLIAADDAGYLLMETEARARAKRAAAETDAAHTPPAADKGND